MFKKSIWVFTYASIFLSGCQDLATPSSPSLKTSAAATLGAGSIADESAPSIPVKNVILMIGDGMGVQQIGLLEEYARRAPHSIYNKTGNKTALTKVAEAGQVGLSLTAPWSENGSLVVDSACSATQLATGVPAGSEMIGLDSNGTITATILEKAKAQGKATGLVSDTRITHATPAAFATHQPHRSFENNIAEELITSGNVDVLLSGGAQHFLPMDIKSNQKAQQFMQSLGAPISVYKKSKRTDNRNLFDEAKHNYGYQLAFNQTQLAHQQTSASKLLGLFAKSGMTDGIAYSACKKAENCAQPSLREMTLAALEILSQNEQGFFLMVEGGQIDWAGHINDAGWMLHELLKFDEAVNAVYDWVKMRNDTLLVITGDHETGGFGFSYSRHNIPAEKHLPVTEKIGNGMAGKPYKPNFNFGDVATLERLYKQSGTFYDMLYAANPTGDFANTAPAAWFTAVNQFSDFKITLEEATQIAQREPNEFVHKHHKYLANEQFPKINDFKEFYVYGDDLHGNLIGRALAHKQNIVWATGTHTAAPVTVYAVGPADITKQFSSMQHHTDLANKMMRALLTD